MAPIAMKVGHYNQPQESQTLEQCTPHDVLGCFTAHSSAKHCILLPILQSATAGFLAMSFPLFLPALSTKSSI